MFYLWLIKYLLTLYLLKKVCTYHKVLPFKHREMIVPWHSSIVRRKRDIDSMWPATSQWVIIRAISSWTYLFVCKGRPQCLGGKGKSEGGCFLQGIVSVWVSYLQGAAVPHSLFFAPTCDTEARLTTPLFPFPRFSVCICIKLCVSVCVRVRVHAHFGRLLLLWQMERSPRPDYQTHIIEIRAVLTVELSLPLCS